MELLITFIRSGMTESGRENRFLGMLDEPLTSEGASQIRRNAEAGIYRKVERVYTGALIRCRETAGIIYPQFPAIVTNDLRAFDFGEFTGKTYSEAMAGDLFKQWVSADILESIPGGETLYAAATRSEMGFSNIAREMERAGAESAAIITHRTVILSVLRRFCVPRRLYEEPELTYGSAVTISYDSGLNTARIKNTL